MPDNPGLVDKYIGQLRQIMLDMRHDGIPHRTIHHVFSELTKDLETMARAAEGLEGSPEIP